MPTLCGLCGLPIPRTTEGHDLSAALRGEEAPSQQNALFCMNFGSRTDYCEDGREWRGIRTKDWQYTRWLDARVELYDLRNDPLQNTNLADDPSHAEMRDSLENRLQEFLKLRGDKFLPGSAYEEWVDEQRRVIRNGYGPLPHPEEPPDWSLLV